MSIIELPPSFLRSEKVLTELSKDNIGLFISPYPKLPLFGCYAKAAHIIHDILDLTHPLYRRRLKALFDGYRLKKALRRADLTWYDSSWSLNETETYAGYTGKNPRVRYPGIDERFTPVRSPKEGEILTKYGLEPGFILAVGNGLPHKNLGILLDIADQMERRLVFIGVPSRNQSYWKALFPKSKAQWIEHVHDEDLPSVLRRAFCVAQSSTAEGYGYPPLEAMSCGIPVVVSHIPILFETTGSVALYADPHDPRSWQLALETLENDEIYRTQAEKGLKWVTPLIGRRAWATYVSDVYELLSVSTNAGYR
jgi:glycosyltransferase involved in cell wall biosynthesis